MVDSYIRGDPHLPRTDRDFGRPAVVASKDGSPVSLVRYTLDAAGRVTGGEFLAFRGAEASYTGTIICVNG